MAPNAGARRPVTRSLNIVEGSAVQYGVEGATLGGFHGVPMNTPLFHLELNREKAERSRDPVPDFANSLRGTLSYQYNGCVRPT